MAFPATHRLVILPFIFLSCIISSLSVDPGNHGGERDALFAIKSSFNHSFLNKNWTGVHCYLNNPPRWYGISCLNGRVTGISLENLGLVGRMSGDALANLTDLSALNLAHNSISGRLVDFSFATKLTRISLSHNNFHGPIPNSLVNLQLLKSLRLEHNKLTGQIPEFGHSSLREFNVSDNELHGPVPSGVQAFGHNSISGNSDLCGPPSQTKCAPGIYQNDVGNGTNSSSSSPSGKMQLVTIFVTIDVIGVIIVLILLYMYRKKSKELQKLVQERGYQVERKVITGDEKEESIAVQQEKGKLAFLNKDGHEQIGNLELDDLLKASAEGLGRGNFSNTFKVLLTDGPSVVVKRLKDLKPMSNEEFQRQLRFIAELKHPNLISPLAYYSSKDEKLMVYKYARRGNLFNRIHGRKSGKDPNPFKWNARVSVARGVARGLDYLHSNTKSPQVIIPHGNLKTSNILLDEDDFPLISDYSLLSIVSLPIASARMASYESPEYQASKKISRKSDVWCYGILLLELLTGRTSVHSAPAGTNGVDLDSWVHRTVREEWTAEIFDMEISVQRSAATGMFKLLQIAMRCCQKQPEKRPEMSEVVKEVETLQAVESSEEDEDASVEMSFESLGSSIPSGIAADER